MTAPYDVFKAIRDLIDETDLTDPGDIAAKVAGDVPTPQLRSALVMALRHIVRVEFHRPPRPKAVVEPMRPMAGQVNSARSSKVAAVRQAREAWRTALRQRIHVGPAEFKLLLDCTLDDLRFAVQERLTIAAQTSAAAERIASWIQAMVDHGVRRFGDLPEHVQRALLDGGVLPVAEVAA